MAGCSSPGPSASPTRGRPRPGRPPGPPGRRT
jgi:hypothetical protein